MLRNVQIVILCAVLALSWSAAAATGRVIKVLPLFLDLKGQRALTPSLYDRDAYQAILRQHPDRCSGISFSIQWRTRGGIYAPVKLRIELIGTAKGDLPTRAALETEVHPGGWFSHWTSLRLTGEEYDTIGAITAWRVTLWEGDELIGEQKSFLW